MLITSEMHEQFLIKAWELWVSHPDSRLRHAAEVRIMFKLRDVQQTLWLGTLTTGHEAQASAAIIRHYPLTTFVTYMAAKRHAG